MLTTIGVNIKTFCATRKTFHIDINITETIDVLRDMLLLSDDSKELTKYKILRLIYPVVSSLAQSIGKINRVEGLGKDRRSRTTT